VHGRDRKLSIAERNSEDSTQAKISRRVFSSQIISLAVGDFTGDLNTKIAVLTDDGTMKLLSRTKPTGKKSGDSSIANWQAEVLASGDFSAAARLVAARISSVPVDNLVVVDSSRRRLQIFIDGSQVNRQAVSTASLPARGTSVVLDMEDNPAAILPMQLNSDALNDLVILRAGSITPSIVRTQAATTFTVTNSRNSGEGSLFDAITKANQNPGADTIIFNIQEGATTPIIKPFTTPPSITDALTVDGTTQSEGRVIIDGSQAGEGADGLAITGGNSRVRGLAFINFSARQTAIGTFGGNGIVLRIGNNNIIEGNYLGLDASGITAKGNTFGISLLNSSNNTIGGTTAAARNVISGNKLEGITITERNELLNSGHSKNNTVIGNYIGTDVSGTKLVGNGRIDLLVGSLLDDSQMTNNVIGGTTPESRNVIVGSGRIGGYSAILLNGLTVMGAIIQGNYIGTDATGNAILGNDGNGIQVLSATNTLIGGTAPGAGNVVSGNSSPGIALGSFPEGNQNPNPTADNRIQGNFVGTNANGTAALGNKAPGIIIGGFIVSDYVIATNNFVGGTVPGARNIISGNEDNGLMFINNGSRNNRAEGNFIGVNAAGDAKIPNQGSGVVITSTLETVIGGPTPGSANVISGNRDYGIAVGIPYFSLRGESGVRIQGNFIGTDLTGALNLGNGKDGIFVDAGSVRNFILDNIIAFNSGAGVRLPNAGSGLPAYQIEIVGNLISSNVSIGIDLGEPGPTPNQAVNPIPGTANEAQNFPVVGQVNASSGGVVTNGRIAAAPTIISVPVTLRSAPNTVYRIDVYYGRVCDSGGSQSFGSIPIRLGQRTMRTDGAGFASETFTFELQGINSSGFIKTTATGPSGTSELSNACAAVTIAEAGCNISCPPNQAASATSAAGAAVNYPQPVLTGNCTGLTVSSTPPSGSVFPVGTTTVTSTARDSSGSAKGTCSFTVTVTAPPVNAPAITNVSRLKKKLFVFGTRFDNGAKILINGVVQKTSNDSASPATLLVGKKAGKVVKAGDKIKVRNSNGVESPEVTYATQ
jgi:hypothetical protein